MGKIFTASCDCGYTKDDIYVGGGMLNFKTYDPFPHYCPKCKIIFEGNLCSKEPICCDECGSDDVLSYFDEKICMPEVVQKIDIESNRSSPLQRILKMFRKSKRIEIRKPVYESICELEINKFLCPACGEFSLSFECDVFYD